MFAGQVEKENAGLRRRGRENAKLGMRKVEAWERDDTELVRMGVCQDGEVFPHEYYELK